ncbi:MAG TPA: DUF6691 family protein [Gemmatimonadota bacterium]|nr:DUF6691 family protein [Gemmatimonadota bacterium]
MIDPTAVGAEAGASTHPAPRPEPFVLHFVFGLLFGLVLVKSEAVSWFRIQEMFRFQSFHMYGILGSGVVTASTLIGLFRRLGVHSADGEEMRIEARTWQPYANALGGLTFGLGWGLLGACPGPIYALLGSGVTVMAVALASALAGAWTYGQLKPRLPH